MAGLQNMSALNGTSLWQNRTVWIGLTGILVVGLGIAFLATRSGPPSGGSIPQFTLIAPRDGATISLLHRFKWQRIERSTAYHFFLYEVNRTPVWSALVRDTTLVVPPSVELQRSHTYLWRVEAILPEETTVPSELHAFTLSQ
jgi:hypothetical protein